MSAVLGVVLLLAVGVLVFSIVTLWMAVEDTDESIRQLDAAITNLEATIRKRGAA